MGNIWKEYHSAVCGNNGFPSQEDADSFYQCEDGVAGFSLYAVFVFTLSFYCLDRLPVLDFRPYKIGKNILEGMTMPEGAKPSVYESIFILEKNGEQKEFTLDNYPDSTWTFVDTRTILKEKDMNRLFMIFL